MINYIGAEILTNRKNKLLSNVTYFKTGQVFRQKVIISQPIQRFSPILCNAEFQYRVHKTF